MSSKSNIPGFGVGVLLWIPDAVSYSGKVVVPIPEMVSYFGLHVGHHLNGDAEPSLMSWVN